MDIFYQWLAYTLITFIIFMLLAFRNWKEETLLFKFCFSALLTLIFNVCFWMVEVIIAFGHAILFLIK